MLKKCKKNAKILYRHLCQKSLLTFELYYLLDRIIAWIFVVCTILTPRGEGRPVLFVP